MESSSSEKILLKPLKITIFRPNLCKTGVPMGHAQNKKQFFFSEIIKPDPKLSKPFYFNKMPYVLAELWMFFYKCFFLLSAISSHNSAVAGLFFHNIEPNLAQYTKFALTTTTHFPLYYWFPMKYIREFD